MYYILGFDQYRHKMQCKCSWFNNCNKRNYKQQEVFSRVIDVAVDIYKTAIYIKYKSIKPLITMYDIYYFNLFIGQYVILNKNKMTKINKYWQNQLIENDINIDIDSVLKWDNQKAMKLSDYMQKIMLQYEDNIDNIMNELDIVLLFIKTKYQVYSDIFKAITYFGLSNSNTTALPKCDDANLFGCV